LAALARKHFEEERRARAKGAKDAKEDAKGTGKATTQLGSFGAEKYEESKRQTCGALKARRHKARSQMLWLV
jgi:hypothetical protein